jgi:hypothetical protein
MSKRMARILSTLDASALLGEERELCDREIILTRSLGAFSHVRIIHCVFRCRRPDPAPSFGDPDAFCRWLFGTRVDNVTVMGCFFRDEYPGRTHFRTVIERD